MRRRGAANWNLIAALALVILVGFVFFVLQDYGPESALRKFHRAVLNRDLADVRAYVARDASDESVSLLASMVDSYARSGARYRLLRVVRGDRRVLAVVEYVLPNRMIQPSFIWVVEKQGARWRVDVDESLAVRRQMYGA